MIMIDIIGWIGSVMVVAAYALNMYGKMASDSREYYLLNIGGSACLVLNTIYHHAIPSRRGKYYLGWDCPDCDL